MSEWGYQLVSLPDGRDFEVLLRGEGERALVYWTGTPGGAVPHAQLAGICDRLGVGIVMPLRPGYGRSTPHPGRRIADPPHDISYVLQELSIPEVVSIGFSGGGPHSFGTAALAPQCRAAAVVVSPAPRDAKGLDYYDGMGLSNQEEWRLADEGGEAVRPWLERQFELLHGDASEEKFTDLFDDSVAPVDAAALANPVRAAMMSASLEKALEVSIEGWFDDDIALTTPWGFELSTVTTPLTFWVGRQDQFVSWHHTVWMHDQVAGADLHVIGAEGHLSLADRHLDAMIEDLVVKAGWA